MVMEGYDLDSTEEKSLKMMEKWGYKIGSGLG